MSDLTLKSSVDNGHNDALKSLTVVGIPIEQYTGKAGEALEAGAPVYLNKTTNKGTNGDADALATAEIIGINLKTAAAGQGYTVIKKGIVEGFDLSGLSYGDPVYLSTTAGKLATAAPVGDGDVSMIVGRVVGVHGQLPGSNPMKALYVDLFAPFTIVEA
jgi:hypothetical protein